MQPGCVRATASQFTEHMRQHEQLLSAVKSMRQDDAFRRKTDALVGHALGWLDEVGHNHEFLAAHGMP